MVKLSGTALLVLGLMLPCSIHAGGDGNRPWNKAPLFKKLDASKSGVDFNNRVHETFEENFLRYTNIYNGGGVAIADFNNDGLQDIYFTGQFVDNRLYLNKGKLRFKDVTAEAGVAASDFSTGVTTVDINSDGWMDIYVCRSGWYPEVDRRRNLLFVNNQDGTFTEKGKEYGVDDPGHSSQASFFDYDRDGDLDLFVINHHVEFSLRNDFKYNEQFVKGGKKINDHLYRNDNGHYTDVTEKAGISDYSMSLGLVTGDVNNDGWSDIYVANDFLMPDQLWINDQDGTFTESIQEYTKHISYFAMGVDLGDINNDGFLDLINVEMAADNQLRAKTMMASMDVKRFWDFVDAGFHYNYMRNSLQLNNGNGSFSEIAHLAGVSKTDWSWASFLADFDNDGYKDLFIANGYQFEPHNDYKRLKNRQKMAIATGDKDLYEKLMVKMPGQLKIHNYIYQNNGDLTFSGRYKDWGFEDETVSNGAAYADLDNDGDLDLVVNNMNSVAMIYENKANEVVKNNYLRISLAGPADNVNGIGANVTAKMGEKTLFHQHTTTRGFHSACENFLHLGLGEATAIDELTVVWPDGRSQTLKSVQANQTLKLNYTDTDDKWTDPKGTETSFVELKGKTGINHEHKENFYDDFRKEVLLPHKLSQNGPGIAVADVNGDGLEDFFVGGGAGQAGSLFLQMSAGRFGLMDKQPWEAEKDYEDMAALFIDVDNDGDQDLYVVSGSNEFKPDAVELNDRLYINEGGVFDSYHEASIPNVNASGSCVVAADYDKDGDIDLFVGGRVVPGKYPFPARSYILQNDGKGKFSDVTSQVAPELVEPGLVTSAIWTDYDNDMDHDLIVVGEWMPIQVYQNTNGKFEEVSNEIGLSRTNGWWNSVIAGDFDNDGDMDYVVGNVGHNTKYHTSIEHPFQVHCSDFDDNGTYDIVLSKYSSDGTCYPVRGKDCSTEQMPFISQKFPTYEAFGKATLTEVYGEEKLSESLTYDAYEFASSYLENNNGKFELHHLPIRAQFGPLFGMLPYDVDGDGNLDLIAVGNFFPAEVETSRHDAHIGVYMKGDGAGAFEYVPAHLSGLSVPNDAKGLAFIHSGKGTEKWLLVGNNSGKMQSFKLNEEHVTSIAVQPGEVYAELVLKNGKKRRIELSNGGGYLSQTSSKIDYAHSQVDQLKTYDAQGSLVRLVKPIVQR